MHRVFPQNPPVAIPSVEPARALDMVERENALIVDVREPDERAEARIPGSIHIPLGQIPARADEIPRDRPVIMQCRSGNRSAGATRTLMELGFNDVRNLEGGLGDWSAEGLPLKYGEE